MSGTNGMGTIYIDPNAITVTGINVVGAEVVRAFYTCTCPCGVTDKFAWNALPTEDTQQSCGNPKHFAVKFSDEAKAAMAEYLAERSEGKKDDSEARQPVDVMAAVRSFSKNRGI
jgi:hypothetical protein